MTDGLKDCRFCGHNEPVIVVGLRQHKGFGVRCGKPPCQCVIEPRGQTKAEAIAAWNTRQPDAALVEALEANKNLLLILSNLSSYLGAGMGDDNTTGVQFDARIRWGIDHIGRVYRDRAAQVVEECSKRPRTTWGEVKRAILDDTCLEPATLTARAGG